MFDRPPPTARATSGLGTSSGATFELEARRILIRLRVSLAALIEHVPGQPARATDLERALGLGTKLAWQVYRLAHSTADPLSECEYVPGSTGIQQVLDAARAVSVPTDQIQSVKDAMDAFEVFVRRYAGDRPTLNTMAGSLVEGEHELIDGALRRSAYRENSRVWGVQVKTALCAALYTPGTQDKFLDSVLLRGMHEIRRLRGTTPFRLSGARLTSAHINGHDRPMGESTSSPNADLPESTLTASDEPGELTETPRILEAFSTQPLPEFITRRNGDYIETYLPPGPIGLVDAPTYYLASAVRGSPWREQHADPALEIFTRTAVTKPCERMLVDIFLDDRMLSEFEACASSYGSLSHLGQTRPLEMMPEGERLPIEIPPVMRGNAVESIHTPHVPRYGDMFRSVCERMGWDARRFILFRWDFRYPILGSVLYAQIRVPEYGKHSADHVA